VPKLILNTLSCSKLAAKYLFLLRQYDTLLIGGIGTVHLVNFEFPSFFLTNYVTNLLQSDWLATNNQPTIYWSWVRVRWKLQSGAGVTIYLDFNKAGRVL